MPKPNDLMQLASAETVIGTGVRVRGTLISDGDISIDGTVAGDAKTDGDLMLGVNAVVKAGLRAVNVTVAGQLKGNITATGQTTITSTGKVIGDITTGILEVGPGATIIGKITMTNQEDLLDADATADEPKPKPKS